MINQIYDGVLHGQLHQQYADNFNTEEIKKIANDFLTIIKQGLKEDRQVKITKFGTFRVKKVKERKGVNPQTGEQIIIKSHDRIFFKPAKALLDRINSEVLNEENQPKSDKVKFKVAAKQIESVAHLVIKEEQIFNKTEDKRNNKAIIAASLLLGVVLVGVIYQTQSPTNKTPFIAKTQNTNAVAKIEKPVAINETISAQNNIVDNSTIPPIITDINITQNNSTILAEENDTLFDEVMSYNDIAFDESDVIDNEEQQNTEAQTTSEEPLEEANLYTEAEISDEDVLAENDLFYDDAVVSETIATKEVTEVSEIMVSEQAVVQNKPFFSQTKYKLKYGDNLWNLAKNNYKAPILWPHIYHDNQQLIKNPNFLKTNKTIVIPQLDGNYKHMSDIDNRNVAEGYWLLYQHYKKSGNKFSIFALLGVKQFDANVIEENKATISHQDMQDFLAMAEV